MNICVFCSANDLKPIYTEPAKELARELAWANHTLIWGGSNTGLMREIASAAQEAGGRIVGISVEYLRDRVRPDADEMIITDNLAARKALMLERADALVVLVGGIGTLDETSEILELKKHRQHSKSVIVLNTDGFYDGLQLQIKRMAADGFLPRTVDELITFVSTPEEVLDYLTSVSAGLA